MPISIQSEAGFNNRYPSLATVLSTLYTLKNNILNKHYETKLINLIICFFQAMTISENTNETLATKISST